ncbi:hypothetical protein ARMGADRAFT_1037750 [Armillaria gallica]|uniref:Uncharacterized protein n=1 Tax=Armillaria gallica TaxID=47427 RepID=A0A2H3CKG3_ARMGA|nr:hypothetical protein ARMGADRAFT_1037750 [Armillaria gallica]
MVVIVKENKINKQFQRAPRIAAVGVMVVDDCNFSHGACLGKQDFDGHQSRFWKNLHVRQSVQVTSPLEYEEKIDWPLRKEEMSNYIKRKVLRGSKEEPSVVTMSVSTLNMNDRTCDETCDVTTVGISDTGDIGIRMSGLIAGINDIFAVKVNKSRFIGMRIHGLNGGIDQTIVSMSVIVHMEHIIMNGDIDEVREVAGRVGAQI